MTGVVVCFCGCRYHAADDKAVCPYCGISVNETPPPVERNLTLEDELDQITEAN